MMRIIAAMLLVLSTLLPASDSTDVLGRTRTPAPRRVRIGVLGLFHSRVFTITALPGQALVLRAGQEKVLLEVSSGTSAATIRLSVEGALVTAGTRVLQAPSIHVSGRNGESVRFHLGVPEKITRSYQGTLDIGPSNGELRAAVTMDLETAVASIVAAENESDSPLEAMKAQAIATRSYLVSGRGRHSDFDFCDTTHCQFLRDLPAPNSPAGHAVVATRGMILTYKGRTFSAMYTRSCSGQTKTAIEVGLHSEEYPYFAVECKHCLSHPARWATRISMQDAVRLRASDEASRLDAVRRLGWSTVPSNDFMSEKTGDEVLLRGTGYGHGVGLCQAGARAMAEGGASFSDILSHYYPNTAIVHWRGKD